MLIFISYSRHDGGVHARWIDTELTALGFETWLDRRDVSSTSDFTADIENNIERATYIVVCITRDATRQNSFVRREIQYALYLDKPVIPVRFEAIVPPISIFNNEWVDVFSDRGLALQRLCAILNGPRLANRRGTGADNQFRPYVQRFYKRMVKYLDRAVIREIELSNESEPQAVCGLGSRREMFDLMFSPHHAEEDTLDVPIIFGSFSEAFEHYRGRVLLLGEPGAGKTVTLIAYARDAAAANLEDPTNPLPIFGRITTWKDKDSEEYPQLEDWLAASYEDLKAEDIKRVFEDGKAILLLDGLDELAKGHKEFLRLLPANNQILISSRLGLYHSLGEKVALNGAIVLRPMTDAQISDYLKDQPELLALVRTDERLHEIVRTPLLLSLFAFTYKNISVEERAQLSEIDSARGLRDRLFLNYLEKRYSYEERKSGKNLLPFSLEQVYDRLGWLASFAVNRDQTNLHIEDFKFAEFAVNRDQTNLRFEDFKEVQFTEFATLLNLVVPVDSSTKDEYQFIHLLLRDALAFRYCTINIRLYYTAHASDDNLLGFGWDYHLFNAVDVLGKLNDKRAVEPIIQLLGDRDGTLRVFACQVLGEMQAYQAVDPLIAILRDGTPSLNSNLQYFIIAALGDIGDPKAESVIKKTLNSKNASIRKISSQSLVKIRENASRSGNDCD